MEGAKFGPPDRGSRSLRRSVPERPRRAHSLPTSSTPRLTQQKLNRLKGGEPIPDLGRNLEDSQKPEQQAPMDVASEQTSKLPAPQNGRLGLSSVLDVSVPIQVPKNLNLVASSPANEEAFRERPSEDSLHASGIANTARSSVGSPEASEQAQHLSPGSAVQQQLRASTHVASDEHTPPSNDLVGRETWHIPVAGEFAARQSLFRSILRWLGGK